MAWCTALCLVAAALSNKLFNFGKLIILSIPFLTETAQYFSLVPGVFDWYDLLWYMVTICGFAFYFPNITPFNMKKVTSNLVAVAIAGAFLAMAFACATTGKTAYRKPVPQPCVKHQPLNYSPILVKVNLGGSYTMTDLAEAQRTRPAYIVNALNALTYNKYQLADGVTPNLSLTITVTTDSYGHYGAEINGSVYDGTFYNSIPSNYITFEKLYDDIAAKVNVYMTRGWCKNCPDPCVIN